MTETDREEQRQQSEKPKASSAIRWKAFVDEALDKDHQRRAQLATQTSAKVSSRSRVAALLALVALLVLIALVVLWFLIH